ncbi:MAG TPA: glycosyltransferase [Candidatus Sulfotelmatobacter sp.]|nr:glycosyltransferase [Candidatus Sulfotelmatobacter sp.]
MRIVMYVQNAVTYDSRVLREAASLAAAGHRVTVIGVAHGPDEPSPSTELVGDVTIIRVAWPPSSTWWVTMIAAPWQLLPLSLASARRALSTRPRQPVRAVRAITFALVSLPWVAIRAAWVVIVNRALGRPSRLPGLEYVRRWRAQYLAWDRAAVAAAPPADVHHAHDMEALPAARMAARRDRAVYVYDSHEIFTELRRVQEQPRWLRWAMARWERRMACQAAGLVTINEAVGKELTRRLAPRRVVIVRNCPPRWTPPVPPEDRLRRAAGIPSDSPVVLCHGAFRANQGLEQTADAMLMPGLGRAHLVFLGYRSWYIEPILASDALSGRVHDLPAVAPDDLLPWVAGADVTVMTVLPHGEGLNSYLSTPNKLFESLAAGVPVVTSDIPERRRIVMDDPAGPLGAVCEPTSPAAVAAAIRGILELPAAESAALRARCLAAAHRRWNWETESARLVAFYADLA